MSDEWWRQFFESESPSVVGKWPGSRVLEHITNENGQWPIVFVEVVTPKDQAELHRTLARLGYCPVLIDQNNEADYWRFHHPEGAQPK